MIPEILATAAAASNGVDPQTVGLIIASIIGSLITGGFVGKKVSDKVHVGPQPFVVEMKREFITRDEHNQFRAEMRADFIRMEGTINRMSDKVETKHLELLATIERAAKTGVDGRVALWNEIKPLQQEVAALKATTNVAAQLEKLGASITKPSCTHGKTTG